MYTCGSFKLIFSLLHVIHLNSNGMHLVWIPKEQSHIVSGQIRWIKLTEWDSTFDGNDSAHDGLHFGEWVEQEVYQKWCSFVSYKHVDNPGTNMSYLACIIKCLNGLIYELGPRWHFVTAPQAPPALPQIAKVLRSRANLSSASSAPISPAC